MWRLHRGVSWEGEEGLQLDEDLDTTQPRFPPLGRRMHKVRLRQCAVLRHAELMPSLREFVLFVKIGAELMRLRLESAPRRALRRTPAAGGRGGLVWIYFV